MKKVINKLKLCITGLTLCAVTLLNAATDAEYKDVNLKMLNTAEIDGIVNIDLSENTQNDGSNSSSEKPYKKYLMQGRKKWINGYLDQAINIVQKARNLAPENIKIRKTLKSMQIQKKMIDDALMQTGKLIDQKEFDQAGRTLVKAGYISKKYLPYKEMERRLMNAAKKDLDSAAMISAKHKKYKEILKQLTDAKRKAVEKKTAKLLKDAGVLKNAGKLDEAVAILKKGNKEFPSNKEINKLLKEVQKLQNDARKKMKEGQKQWKEGLLGKAVLTLKEAAKIDVLNKQITKILKAMQSQKKMMDKTLMQTDKLIEEERFDQAEDRLKKASRISKKYALYLSRKEALQKKKKAYMSKLKKMPDKKVGQKDDKDINSKSLAGKWIYSSGDTEQRYICDLILTRKCNTLNICKIYNNCTAKASFWLKMEDLLVFLNSNAAASVIFAETKKGQWKGQYIGDNNLSTGYIRYLKRREK